MVKKGLNEEEARRKAKIRSLSFYDNLEKRIKRHLPQEYIPYMGVGQNFDPPKI